MNMNKIKSALSQVLSTGAIGVPTAADLQSPLPAAHGRPPVSKRRFVCLAVEQVIEKAKTAFEENGKHDLAELFENCYPNTLDTTVQYHGLEGDTLDTFIITGDIPAMWLRDSTNQIAPYMRLAKNNQQMRELILGLINRQAKCLLTNVYANAFKRSRNQWGEWDKDFVRPPVDPIVWEGKWEVDSVAAFLRLANSFYDATSDSTFINDDFIRAVNAILDTVKEQQRGSNEEMDSPAYMFKRVCDVGSDTLVMGGRGRPAKRCGRYRGLVKSAFRPSDDATELPFLIPSNAMLSRELGRLSHTLQSLNYHTSLAEDLLTVSSTISDAIYAHGVLEHPKFGRIFAYEVDGYGNALFMDDANVPSLLSLPYLGFVGKDDPLYQRTRALVLSDSNMWYFSGESAHGIGSLHTGLGMIWPMSIIMQAMTSKNAKERDECLDMIIRSSAGTGFMHESFHMDDPHKFTRSWFAWANSLLGELLVEVATELSGDIFASGATSEHLVKMQVVKDDPVVQPVEVGARKVNQQTLDETAEPVVKMEGIE
ncbi:hypothetical protein HDU85_007601 [Gaertneriomyces sp. JEL0708]|nr:hypothetical protein HDU85_007601 [Gaertneriomyces sp. JEL0708]